jgi:TRAP-type C4-dicarboxylate transport system permease small subunit
LHGPVSHIEAPPRVPAAAARGCNMKALFAAIDRSIELMVAAIFSGMVVIGSWQVFSRFVLNSTPSWSEEVQIFGHIWLVFLAIPIAYRRGAHITVEAIRRLMLPWLNRAFALLNELLWVGFAIATAYYSYRVSLVTGNSVSPGLEIPMSYPYYGMILGSLYLLFVVVRRLAGELPAPAADQLPPEVAAP